MKILEYLSLGLISPKDNLKSSSRVDQHFISSKLQVLMASFDSVLETWHP